MADLKYSFLIPYVPRAAHLDRVLCAFRYWYGTRKDFELILVPTTLDDPELERLCLHYGQHLQLRTQATDRPDTPNSCRRFNVAAGLARGQFLVITGPEIKHVTNVLAAFDQEFAADPGAYLVPACANVEFATERHIGWYQHSVYNNRRLHWCTAISRANWEKIGGFDERYCQDMGWEDDDWLARVENAHCPIVVRDDVLVYHLQHGRGANFGYAGGPLINPGEKNAQLYYKTWPEAGQRRNIANAQWGEEIRKLHWMHPGG